VYNKTIFDAYSHIDYNYNVSNAALPPTTTAITEVVTINITQQATDTSLTVNVAFSSTYADLYDVVLKLYATNDLTNILDTKTTNSFSISIGYNNFTYNGLSQLTSYTIIAEWSNTNTDVNTSGSVQSAAFQTPITESIILTYTNVVEASSYIEGTLTFTQNTGDTYTLTSKLNDGTASSIALPFTNPIKFDTLEPSTSYTIRYDWSNTTRGTSGYILDTYTTEALPSASVSITPDIYSVLVSLSNVVLVQGRTYDLKVYVDNVEKHTTNNLTGNIGITISQLPANTSQTLRVDILNVSTGITTTIHEASFQTLVELVPDHNHTIAYTTNQTDTELTLTLTTFQSNYPNFSYKILPYLHDITANQTYLPSPLSIVLSQTTYTNAGGGQQFVFTDFPYSTQLTIKTEIQNNTDATDAYTLDGATFTTSPAPTPTITAFTAVFEVDGNGDPITTNNGVSYNVNLSYTTTNSTFIDNYIYNNGYTDTFTARSSLTNPSDNVVLSAQFPLNDTTVQGKLSSTEVSGVVDTENASLIVPEILSHSTSLILVTTNSIQFETSLSTSRLGDTYTMYFTLTSNGSTIQTSQTYSYAGSAIQHTFENLTPDVAYHVNIFWSNTTHPSGTTSGTFDNVISTRTEKVDNTITGNAYLTHDSIEILHTFNSTFTDSYEVYLRLYDASDTLIQTEHNTCQNGYTTFKTFSNLLSYTTYHIDIEWVNQNSGYTETETNVYSFTTSEEPENVTLAFTPTQTACEYITGTVNFSTNKPSDNYTVSAVIFERPDGGSYTTLETISSITLTNGTGNIQFLNLISDKDHKIDLIWNNNDKSTTDTTSHEFRTDILPDVLIDGITPSFEIVDFDLSNFVTAVRDGVSRVYDLDVSVIDDTSTQTGNVFNTQDITSDNANTFNGTYQITGLTASTNYHLRSVFLNTTTGITTQLTDIPFSTTEASTTPQSVLITPNYRYTGPRLYFEQNDHTYFINNNLVNVNPLPQLTDKIVLSVFNTSPYAQYDEWHVFDGLVAKTDDGTGVLPNNQGWLGEDDSWIQLDFLNPRSIHRIKIWNYREAVVRGVQQMKIFASNEIITYSPSQVFGGSTSTEPIYENLNIELYSQAEADSQTEPIPPEFNIALGITARYIRIYVKNANIHNLIGLQEIQVYGDAESGETVYGS
jgi:hypothetical protein